MSSRTRCRPKWQAHRASGDRAASRRADAAHRAVGDWWKPIDGDLPALRILLLLAAVVGVPYFVLSTTGPLVQAWFARLYPGRSPYRLYSLSNIGSLAALLTYPFFVETTLARRYAGLCLVAGVHRLRSADRHSGAVACGDCDDALTIWRRISATSRDRGRRTGRQAHRRSAGRSAKDRTKPQPDAAAAGRPAHRLAGAGGAGFDGVSGDHEPSVPGHRRRAVHVGHSAEPVSAVVHHLLRQRAVVFAQDVWLLARSDDSVADGHQKYTPSITAGISAESRSRPSRAECDDRRRPSVRRSRCERSNDALTVQLAVFRQRYVFEGRLGRESGREWLESAPVVFGEHASLDKNKDGKLTRELPSRRAACDDEPIPTARYRSGIQPAGRRRESRLVFDVDTYDFKEHVFALSARLHVALFLICMVCHGELVKSKPQPKYLTSFYLSISAGGALGGLFVALDLPADFQDAL